MRTALVLWRSVAALPRPRSRRYDTTWDVMRTLDVLVARADIDPARLGLTGISLGGAHPTRDRHITENTRRIPT